MATEIERKFLMSPSEFNRLNLAPTLGRAIEQTYVAEGLLAVRVRVFCEQEMALLTLKGAPIGNARPEFEYPIPKADALAMASIPGAAGLEKTRFEVEHGGLVWEIDQYHGPLTGLFTAEVETISEDTPVDIPSWVGREVSGQRAWDNETLAKVGLPAGFELQP